MDSKFGTRIFNFDAAVVYEYGLGIRENLSYTPAVLPNSLLRDFLMENGMKVNKRNETSDIICLRFNFGSNSFEKELKKIEKLVDKAVDEEQRDYYLALKQKCIDNQDLYHAQTISELRELFYAQGVEIRYKKQTIKYRMFYRTPGKAKKGEVMFINEKLYDKAINFIQMGIELPEHNAPLVEMAAYQSLVTSSIIDRIQIDPSQILVLKDVDSFITTNVISVEVDEEKHCLAKTINDYKLKNTLFDGQALIDLSIFPEWAEGYILLRHHFFKAAAFATDIQGFFKDYFGEDYDRACCVDMWGNQIVAKQIKMITTDNAIKFLKLGVDYGYWAQKIREANDARFGIVKTAHQSKFGDVQRMSYQMVNALNMQSMDSVIKTSKEYINQLKRNDEVFVQFLKDNASFANDYEVLIALYERNKTITQTDYFRERRSEIIRSYVLDFKNGRALQNADNLVIVGNPYAELLHAVGEDPFSDPTFETEPGTIQVFTERFDDDQNLACFRSPFNSQNNLCYLHNHYHPLLQKYFRIGKQCIAVNMIQTDFQARNNGSDQDSDMVYTTDLKEIVSWAKECITRFPTIDNNIPKESNHYDNTMEDMAAVDSKLAAASMAIGESSNLAQLGLTYSFNFEDSKYKQFTCILAVLAQVAIDNAKRAYDIDIVAEIKRLKADMNIKENGLPLFWFYIKRKGKFAQVSREKNRRMENYNPSLACPMNYLCKTTFPYYRPDTPNIRFLSLLEERDYEVRATRKSRRVESFITKYAIDYKKTLRWDIESDESDTLLLETEFDELISDIRRLYISKEYEGVIHWLLQRGFGGYTSYHREISTSSLYKNRPALIKALYTASPETFLNCFKEEVDTPENV